jgi:hypothetical protein
MNPENTHDSSLEEIFKTHLRDILMKDNKLYLLFSNLKNIKPRSYLIIYDREKKKFINKITITESIGFRDNNI